MAGALGIALLHFAALVRQAHPVTGGIWSRERCREVLVHDLAHIRRRDCLTQLLANLACIVFWFQPFVGWAAQRMLVERERACDDQVLLRGTRASDYADNLLEIARGVGVDRRTALLGPAMARRSQISGRLLAVLDPRLKRVSPGAGTIGAGLVAMLLVTAPLSCLGPGVGEQESHLTVIDRDGLAEEVRVLPKTPFTRGRYLSVWKFEGGRWHIHWDITNI